MGARTDVPSIRKPHPLPLTSRGQRVFGRREKTAATIQHHDTTTRHSSLTVDREQESRQEPTGGRAWLPPGSDVRGSNAALPAANWRRGRTASAPPSPRAAKLPPWKGGTGGKGMGMVSPLIKCCAACWGSCQPRVSGEFVNEKGEFWNHDPATFIIYT